VALNNGVKRAGTVEPLEMLEDSTGASGVDAVLCFQVCEVAFSARFPSSSTRSR
jgi:hypothetical protein